MNEDDLIMRILKGEMPLCQFCGTDSRWRKGTGKQATTTTSSGDSVCEQCRQEFEDALEVDESEE